MEVVALYLDPAPDKGSMGTSSSECTKNAIVCLFIPEIRQSHFMEGCYSEIYFHSVHNAMEKNG